MPLIQAVMISEPLYFVYNYIWLKRDLLIYEEVKEMWSDKTILLQKVYP